MTVQKPKHTTAPEGLSSAEAGRRLAADGANAAIEDVQHPIGRAASKFWAPVPWMLESTIAVQIGLGEHMEALAIAALLVFNAALSFFQEGKAQATLDALKSRLAITASARRDAGSSDSPTRRFAAPSRTAGQ